MNIQHQFERFLQKNYLYSLGIDYLISYSNGLTFSSDSFPHLLKAALKFAGAFTGKSF